MSNIDKERSEHKLFTILSTVLAVCFFAILLLQFGFVYVGIKSGEYTWIQYFVEYGDSFGAILAAFSIAFFLFQLQAASRERLETLIEADKDRKRQIDESRLNRRIELVRERLDFYSMLYDDFLDVFDISEPNEEKAMVTKRTEINRIFHQNNIKTRYPRYADRNDLIYFEDYYVAIYRELVLKNMSEKVKEEAKMIINSLIYHVIDKYGKLSIEYVALINQ